ncbi:hypothetical protein [Pedobacter africanus]|uniref:Uncharacterized protein n=1 Tax=Pedobacter africanus TaxID=151894 RepID=A0A1W2BQP4_9SPHI|nr:hypothetical protein [Pedobacter africanus]SMC75249.1 hypothetical protein SAMN04488524_2563 [Pedobacter africanus]
MKKALLSVFMLLIAFVVKSQTIISGNYKVIDIGNNGYGDYTKSLILLHEVYNGTFIEHNFASGTITAMRGSSSSGNRQNVALINTSSSYNGTVGALSSFDDYDTIWKLKTCMYQGKKYMAVDVPYNPAYHDLGFKFLGATASTGENMKCVSYEVNGQPVNQNLLSNILDYSPTLRETHDVYSLNVTGNLGIGVGNPQDKLAVNGKIRAHEIKVETANWPDYVFAKDHQLPTLQETEKHIKDKGHLPGIPSAAEVKANGIDLGEMNAKLLQKIEELTLYLIEMKKDNIADKTSINELKTLTDKLQLEIDQLKSKK